ncbi:MAG TPA: RNA polymerase sigma-70 factor [Solirubrobacteraceae bacterium]
MASPDVTYAELRGLAFAVAYRMVGSVSEAEDLVQEALLRLHRAHQEGGPANPEAWITTVTTRLAIDHLKAARTRRERYVGEWLPEPLLGEAAPGVEAVVERDESLSLAFLVVLETLSPVERAVFLLREVFDYSYEEIAPIVERTEANCRQIALRARKHVEARRPRFEPSPELREELAGRFFAALSDGDVDGLVAVLADDVALHGDGGGRVPALARSLHGAPRVARTLMAWVKAGRRADARLEPALVNGQPGARIVDRAGRTVSVMEVEVADGAVRAVHSVVNPDKLAHLGPLADYVEALRRRGPGR